MATDTLTTPATLSYGKTKVFKNFIDGEWVEASTGETFENRNPADTRDLVGIFQKSAMADVDSAVAAAKRAFTKWRLVPAPRRAEGVFRACAPSPSKPPGGLGGSDGRVHVSLGGFLEDADQVAGVGGIAVLERLSGRGLDPFAVNEILENLGLAVVERGWTGQSIGCHDVS